LGKGLGWHYLLDLAWCVKQLEIRLTDLIVDAGAGWGLLQFWLAEQGFEVISVDRMKRKKIPVKIDQAYQIVGFRKSDLWPEIADFLPPRQINQWHTYPKKIKSTLEMISRSISSSTNQSRSLSKYGKIKIYNKDIRYLNEIADNSIDWILSISALEHNTLENIQKSINELTRIAKPGGKIIATMCASQINDWYHKPSKGWCLSEEYLLQSFNPEGNEYYSNYADFEEIYNSIQNCDELRTNLSDFYYKSGDNGMPWGIWDPKYIPVGIVKEIS
jgi:2-polyprenyl-3-methyl-5-hydroxy-6-metoxy-1,4-benzoquinol methylase